MENKMFFASKLVLHMFKTFDITSPRALPASLYCKIVELYTTMKWKTTDLKYFEFWHDCLSNLRSTPRESLNKFQPV